MAPAQKTINDLGQWKLLFAISTVFSSDIPWMAFEAGGCDYVVARESADLFKVHFGLIPAHISADSVLYETTEERFLRGIKPLLYMLEQIVMNSVCDEREDHISEMNTPDNITGLNKEYPRLVALSRLTGSQTSTSLTRFICLNQSAAYLKRMRLEVESFIADVEMILDHPIRIENKTPQPDGKKPLTWFKSSLCADSTRLFDSLSNHLRSCTAVADHSARLHLKHFPQEGRDAIHLELCVLFERCSAQEASTQSQRHWQETHCVVPSIGHSPGLEGVDRRVFSICRETQEARKADKVFAIQLCDEDFLDISASRIDQGPTSSDLTPTFALSSFLDGELLQQPYRFFPMDKMILAYTLAQALLAFHEGPWLQNIWTMDNIFFLYSPNERKVYNIHQPYISCIISQERPPMDDTLRSGVSHPLIFSFAKLLAELHTGRRVQLKAGQGFFSTFRDLCTDWRKQQLPVHYTDAFEACVFFDKHFRQDRIDDSNTTIYDTILNRIVRPLEKVVDLTERSGWGLRDLDLESRVTTFDRQSTLGRFFESSYAANLSPPAYTSGETDNSPKVQRMLTDQSTRLPDTERMNDHRTSCNERVDSAPMLFDARHEKGNRWDTWLFNFVKKFREEILPFPVNKKLQQRVRVTVIDTGIDESHPYIKSKGWSNEPLFCDFVKPGSIPSDEDGHGTFIAGIFLEIAPYIELSIARIGVTRKSMWRDGQIGEKIGNAIRYAITTWETNIISLSFGLEKMSYEIRNALEEAAQKNVVVLAAAGNAGNEIGIPFPASMKGVFKIFAADAYGKWADFSPPPADEDRSESFFILGCGVVSAWPSKLREQYTPDELELMCYTEGHRYSEGLCGDECDIRTTMSGSSFATPIAEALVALIYQFYDEHGALFDLPDEQFTRLKTPKAVHAVLNKMSIKSPEAPYKFLNPMRGDDNFFKYDWIQRELKRRTYIKFFRKRLCKTIRHAVI